MHQSRRSMCWQSIGWEPPGLELLSQWVGLADLPWRSPASRLGRRAYPGARLLEPEPGVLAVIGCNGRGIAMTTSLGMGLARFLTGASNAPPVPITTLRPKPFHWLVRQAPRVYIALARIKDRRESGWG